MFTYDICIVVNDFDMTRYLVSVSIGLCLCVITQKMEICYLWEYGDEKTQIVVWKVLVNTMGIKSANLKDTLEFCSLQERPQTTICYLEWLGRLKCLVTQLIILNYPVILSHQHSTIVMTVSLEIYPLYILWVVCFYDAFILILLTIFYNF